MRNLRRFSDLISDQAFRLLLRQGRTNRARFWCRAGRAALLIGETRLSVVYKEDVPTPMQRDGAVISFNGEIYNWLPLRRRRRRAGASD